MNFFKKMAISHLSCPTRWKTYLLSNYIHHTPYILYIFSKIIFIYKFVSCFLNIIIYYFLSGRSLYSLKFLSFHLM